MYGNNNNYAAQNFPFYDSNGNSANTLSHIQQEEEDVIAQSLGIMPPQQQAPVQQPQANNALSHVQQRAQQDLQPNQQLPQMPFRPQQLPQAQPASQMNINGRSISISLSPDGTVTITIN